MTKRGGKGKPVIFGSRDDNVLEGTDRNDLIFGFKGDDILDGGAGNDILFGGKGNDFLDGGNGNDLLLGGKGDDWFNYTLSENEGAKDYYDGGKGFDTLQLTLTSAELQLAQGEIDAFKAFLAGGSNKVFHFESFGLSVRDFEDLVIVGVGGGGNSAPVANPDSASTNEDSDVAVDALDNDTDVDSGATLTLVSAVVTAGGLGTASIVGGQIVYSPGDAYQYLGADESADVTIGYGIEDEHGAAASSLVEIEVKGLNDAPETVGDAIPANEDESADPFNVLDNDTDIDANDTLSVVAVNGEAANVGATILLSQGGLLTVGADGAGVKIVWRYAQPAVRAGY